MTDDRMALIELIEQGADGDLIREMLAFADERMMDASREDVLAYMAFPKDAAMIRLVGALMLEQNDEWAVSRRYMTLETIGSVSHIRASPKGPKSSIVGTSVERHALFSSATPARRAGSGCGTLDLIAERYRNLRPHHYSPRKAGILGDIQPKGAVPRTSRMLFG